MNEAVKTRIADLRKKLAARKGKTPYKKNCEEIETEIARLEAILNPPKVEYDL